MVSLSGVASVVESFISKHSILHEIIAICKNNCYSISTFCSVHDGS